MREMFRLEIKYLEVEIFAVLVDVWKVNKTYIFECSVVIFAQISQLVYEYVVLFIDEHVVRIAIFAGQHPFNVT